MDLGGVVVLVVFVVAVVLVWSLTVLNRLARRRRTVDEAWMQLDAELTRRRALVANLVAAVRARGGGGHEALDAVDRAGVAATAARGPARRADAEDTLADAVRGLLDVVDADPDLSGSADVVALRQDLDRAETRIATAVRFHDDAVRGYDATVTTRPTNLVARVGRFSPREPFRGVGDDRLPPPPGP